MTPAAKLLGKRLDELGLISDEPGHLTRTFLSPAMQRANVLVGGWMREAGLAVRVDSVGNLIGRLPSANTHAKTLLLGSHLDTVRDAGKFAGALGVLLPIIALAEFKRRGVTLPYSVEVIGFSEEEGVRFSSSYLGRRGYAGQLDKACSIFAMLRGFRRWPRSRRLMAASSHSRSRLISLTRCWVTSKFTSSRGRCWERRTWLLASFRPSPDKAAFF